MSGKRYAVLIGSNRFPDETGLQDLVCPEQDVDDFNAVLMDPKRGAFTETYPLKNEPSHKALQTINRVLRRAKKEDFVLIYYSGHGKQDTVGELYLATPDTEIEVLESTSIPTQAILGYIKSSPSVRTALILDCCYAGAVGKALNRGSVDDQLSILSRGRGTYVMTSCTDLQVSQEKEGERNGIFSKHLIEGIRSGAADRNGVGHIGMGDLYQYVHAQVTAESHQEPMKWDLEVRDELIVAKSGRMPREERYTKIRRRLYGYGGRGTIADDVVSDAVRIARKPRKELDSQELEYDQLLDEFMTKSLSVGEFVRQWYLIGIRQTDAPSIDNAEEIRTTQTGAMAQREDSEERQRAEEEAKRKAEEEERQRAEEEAKRKAEAVRIERERQKAVEAKRQAEKERQRAEAERIKQERDKAAEAKRQAEKEKIERERENAAEAKRLAGVELQADVDNANRDAYEQERPDVKVGTKQTVSEEKLDSADTTTARFSEDQLKWRREAEEMVERYDLKANPLLAFYLGFLAFMFLIIIIIGMFP